MTTQPIAGPGTVSELVRRYPKLSAAIAFELGVLASSLLKALRRRRASNGSLAKVVDAVALIPRTSARRKAKRNPAVRNKPAGRKARARKRPTKPAAKPTPPPAEAA